jgi:hypothetical protein
MADSAEAIIKEAAEIIKAMRPFVKRVQGFRSRSPDDIKIPDLMLNSEDLLKRIAARSQEPKPSKIIDLASRSTPIVTREMAYGPNSTPESRRTYHRQKLGNQQ